MTATVTATTPEVNSKIQPAFVKHSKHTDRKYPRKYYTINQLMDIILPSYPNIETLAVLFDEMSQGKYNKVNIKPLAVVVINQDGTQHKLEYAKLMEITSGITDISVPNRVFNNVSYSEFSKIKLRRIDIEATTSELETSDGTHTYHKSHLTTNTPNQNILENLQRERTRVLETFVPKEKEVPDSPSIDEWF